jgi:phage terminase small subunit
MIERQKRFAAHYAETGNGAEAARRAGYSGSAARQVIPPLLIEVKSSG